MYTQSKKLLSGSIALLFCLQNVVWAADQNRSSVQLMQQRVITAVKSMNLTQTEKNELHLSTQQQILQMRNQIQFIKNSHLSEGQALEQARRIIFQSHERVAEFALNNNLASAENIQSYLDAAFEEVQQTESLDQIDKLVSDLSASFERSGTAVFGADDALAVVGIGLASTFVILGVISLGQLAFGNGNEPTYIERFWNALGEIVDGVVDFFSGDDQENEEVLEQSQITLPRAG